MMVPGAAGMTATILWYTRDQKGQHAAKPAAEHVHCLDDTARRSKSEPCSACMQTEEDDRPMHPPVILETEILWNPFEDIVARSTKEEREAEALAKK